MQFAEHFAQVQAWMDWRRMLDAAIAVVAVAVAVF